MVEISALPEFRSQNAVLQSVSDKSFHHAFVGNRASNQEMAIFDEKYRVVAVEKQRLTIRGVLTGDVLIINADPETPLTQDDYPLGKLIALSDPSTTSLGQDC